jgi:ATP-dependent helicase YprA (DUF1998 family)
MNDPVGAFDKVRENFILYIKTAFGTQFPGLEREREELLRQPGVICQEPWLEPIPRYELSGRRVSDLTNFEIPGLDQEAIQDFKTLVSCGLVRDYELYRHQVEMLRTALSGRHCVVTAGTGSGKTEAFLLPLFAYLAAESARGNHLEAPLRTGMTGGRARIGITYAFLWRARNAGCDALYAFRREVTKSDRLPSAHSLSIQ